MALVMAFLPYLEGRHGRPRPETTRPPGNISVSASTRMARRGYADGDAEKREERRAHPQIRFRYYSVRQRTVRTARGWDTRAARHAIAMPSRRRRPAAQERQSCRPPVASALPVAGFIAVRCTRTAAGRQQPCACQQNSARTVTWLRR